MEIDLRFFWLPKFKNWEILLRLSPRIALKCVDMWKFFWGYFETLLRFYWDSRYEIFLRIFWNSSDIILSSFEIQLSFILGSIEVLSNFLKIIFFYSSMTLLKFISFEIFDIIYPDIWHSSPASKEPNKIIFWLHWDFSEILSKIQVRSFWNTFEISLRFSWFYFVILSLWFLQRLFQIASRFLLNSFVTMKIFKKFRILFSRFLLGFFKIFCHFFEIFVKYKKKPLRRFF